MGPLRLATVATCLILTLVGCGSEQPAPPPKPSEPAAAQPKPRAPVQPIRDVEVSESAPTEPAPFVYDSRGLRDPFQPFIELTPKKKVKPKVFVPKTPLQRYATEELQLVGIVWAQGSKSKALIEDPEGKGYVVRVGTLVGDRDGRIVRILPEEVVIEERFVDLLGEENVKVATMKLHKPEGEVSP